MGCPQSKEKHISGDPGDVTKAQEKKSKDDVIRSEKDDSKLGPRKTAHAYNDDPLVKGRCDDMLIPEITIQEASDTEDKSFDTSIKDESDIVNGDVSKSEQANTTSKAAETTVNQDDSNVEIDVDLTKNGMTVINKDNESNTVSEIISSSVYVADENPLESVENGHNGVIDVNDININQTVNEITLTNQVK